MTRSARTIGPMDTRPGLPSSTSPRHARRLTAVGIAALLMATVPAAVAGAEPSAGASPGATRTVDTVAGPVTVPVSPQRVVTVDYYTLPDLLELGAIPVGAPLDLGDTLLPDQQPVYDAMAKVGDVSALDFEAISALSPDL